MNRQTHQREGSVLFLFAVNIVLSRTPAADVDCGRDGVMNTFVNARKPDALFVSWQSRN